MLNELILTVMLALVPMPYRPADGTEKMATFRAIASDIDAAVSDPLTELPFDGPAAKAASAVALAVIARTESSYRQDIRDCTVKGDHGRSVSAFQLMRGTSWRHHTEDEICQDHVLAAQLGLDVFGWYRNSGDALSMFQGYASGSPHFVSRAATTQYRYFREQLRDQHIRLLKNVSGGKLYADFEYRPALIVIVKKHHDESISLRSASVTAGQ